MTTTVTQDLAGIVLLFGNIEGTDNILELSNNVYFQFHPPQGGADSLEKWRGEQSERLNGPFLAFIFGKAMSSPLGWVCGSLGDTKKCDVQLAKNHETGVSREHFRTDVSPDTHCPRLTILSKNPVQIHVDERTVTLQQGETFEIISAATIDLGQVTLRAWRPTLSHQEALRYRRNAEAFDQAFLKSLTKFPISLDTSDALTFDLRLGENNTVYRREEPNVGTGSFATVMKVKELHSKQIFAAKVPHFKASDSSGTARSRLESLTKEFRKIIDLRHPNIVQAVEVLTGMQPNDSPWLIMEWIEKDLASVRLDDRDGPILATHVGKGLAFMHSQSYTHRDLKPANILVRLEGARLKIAKIADLGATKYDISGGMQTYTGTSLYMAPEFWEPMLHYTNAVDMWSFGIILLELLAPASGRLEGWDSRSPPNKPEHQKWIREKIRPLEKRLSESFGPLVRGLLCEKPNDRWPAPRSVKWLEENIRADTGSRKRGLSALVETGDDAQTRRIGSEPATFLKSHAEPSPSPTPSTADTELLGSPGPDPSGVEVSDTISSIPGAVEAPRRDTTLKPSPKRRGTPK
ncbi:uncharacterized protein PV07_12535 [Cladophialophora immunda]|uniref:Serine/threonine-protein kinase ATG1 n=1 Tax=Cladophialophora immunda TaxID=569365 RepID=A0A0D2BSR4_9EURO|nr:uncharacterized protein PV07_12535 [Cladophialophora immunda]KIW22073.1 hypothetical protein PV07_12535 [Cladophialophora immunda]